MDLCFRELLADPRIELRRPPPRIPLAELRVATAKFMGSAGGPSIASVADIDLRIEDGRTLRLRRYARSDDPLPVILFCHGGGFVFGDLETHDAMCRSLAIASGMAVIAIDYRRAPEHPFPAALDDAIAVARSVWRDPVTVGVRDGALALAGDSAGGHVVIGAALATRAAGIPLAHLGLLYPVIHPRCDSGSMRTLATGCLLSREAMQWYWECYVPSPALHDDPRVDLLAADLTGLPPTTIVIAECDPLRDENEAFAARLVDAGVPVDVRRYRGMVHGFAGLPNLTPMAAQSLEVVGAALGAALRRRMAQS